MIQNYEHYPRTEKKARFRGLSFFKLHCKSRFPASCTPSPFSSTLLSVRLRRPCLVGRRSRARPACTALGHPWPPRYQTFHGRHLHSSRSSARTCCRSVRSPGQLLDQFLVSPSTCALPTTAREVSRLLRDARNDEIYCSSRVAHDLIPSPQPSP